MSYQQKIKFFIKAKRITIALVVCLIIGLNVLYYINGISNLKEELKTEFNLIGRNLINLINTNESLSNELDRYTSHELRTTAIAINKFLGNDINKINKSDIIYIKEYLDIEEINLLTLDKDENINAVLSSELTEDLRSISRKTDIYNYLYELFLHKKVIEIKKGDNFKNFWSYLLYNEKGFVKNGFYYDGESNYMINTTVTNDISYTAPTKEMINSILDESKMNNFDIFNISIINTSSYITSNFQESLLYGNYLYPTPKDIRNIEEVQKTREMMIDIVSYQNKKLIHAYFPLKIKQENRHDNLEDISIIISVDYKSYSDAFNKLFFEVLLVSLFTVLVSLFILFRVFNYLKYNFLTLTDFHNEYIENINYLVKDLQGLRHDSKHQFYTIKGLIDLNQIDELKKYIDSITKMEEDINDVVNIGILPLSALLNGKIVDAKKQGIIFKHHFHNLKDTNFNYEEISELIRIIGNIIDNAFVAVNKSNNEKKVVGIYGCIENKILIISIYNNGQVIETTQLKKMFRFGYTTNKNKSKHGMGLYNVNKIIKNTFNGTIEVKSNEQLTNFVIKIPF